MDLLIRKPNKNRVNLFDFAVWIIIAIGLFNTSTYGASFSWIITPSALLFIGIILQGGKIRLQLIHILAILFWMVCILSTLISPVVSVQRDLITSALFTVLFILATGSECTINRARRFIFAYMLVAFVGVVVILINWIRGVYYNPWFQRSTITFMGVNRDPNYAAAFLAPLPLLLLLYKSLRRDQKASIIRIICFCLTVLGLIVTGSRGAMLSAFIPVMLYLILNVKNQRKKVLVFICMVIVLVIAYLFVINFLPQQTIDRLFVIQKGDVRLELWKAALKGFYNNPIIGQGIGAGSYYSNALVGIHSHNMYIDILSSTGLVGALLYFSLVLKCAFGSGRINYNIGLLCIAFFLPMFFINGFNTLTMWIPICMIYYCNIYFTDEHKHLTT